LPEVPTNRHRPSMEVEFPFFPPATRRSMDHAVKGEVSNIGGLIDSLKLVKKTNSGTSISFHNGRN